jgi:hypothetical protein
LGKQHGLFKGGLLLQDFMGAGRGRQADPFTGIAFGRIADAEIDECGFFQMKDRVL